MRFTLTDARPRETPCDLLALPVAEPGTLDGEAAAVDSALGGRLSQAAQEDGFTGKRGKTVLLHTPEMPFRRVLLVGLGRDRTTEGLRRYAAVAVRRARDVRASRVALVTREAPAGPDAGPPEGERLRAVVEGAGLGGYRFTRYRPPEDPHDVETVIVCADRGEGEDLSHALEAAEVYVEATCRARDLVNEPPNVLTPAALAEAAREVAVRGRLQCRVIDLEEARAMGMGLFAAVASGSAEPGKIVVLDYRPEPATAASRTVALIGKGVTFDSGGLDIKPASGMRTMKGDMAGAAAVIAAMGALRSLNVRARVVGIAAAAENMVSGRAYRPGDIIRGLGGKTVEITNTDAEGRLLLADAIAYAAQMGAGEIIDLATLTGACVVALGNFTAGIMGNDQSLIDRLLEAARQAGEQVWPLPLYEEFLEAMRGEISDLKNAAGREAGAERAAAFLGEFAGTTPWAHLDIAGPAFCEDKHAPPYLAPGGTGYGVRTLLRYLESLR